MNEPLRHTETRHKSQRILTLDFGAFNWQSGAKSAVVWFSPETHLPAGSTYAGQTGYVVGAFISEVSCSVSGSQTRDPWQLRLVCVDKDGADINYVVLVSGDPELLSIVPITIPVDTAGFYLQLVKGGGVMDTLAGGIPRPIQIIF